MEKADKSKRMDTKNKIFVKKLGSYSVFAYICPVNLTQ